MSLKTDIYNYNDYLTCLKDIYKSGRDKRGYQRRLAEAAGCQPSFISQVMRGKTHLTPDQAAGLCDFWKFSEDQCEYFIGLVNYARSGSEKYKKLLRSKLERLKQDHREISKRVRHRGKVAENKQAEYYSDWTWAVIHIMTSIESFRQTASIASTLGITQERTLAVLESLEKMGLTRKVLDGWKIGDNQIHLDRFSAFNKLNHKNFRHYVMNRLSSSNDPNDLHYSAVYGLDLKTQMTIREMLVNLISEANEKVLASKEQAVACLTMDFFNVGNEYS